MSAANTNTIVSNENDDQKEIQILELKERIYSLKGEIAEKDIAI